ncbi:MAG: carbon starvation protein A [Marinifilaceae bacterium]|jgi:carbon starvation protein CstA|nr:carbon starvation protein A [Marinifilaceae bacterium]
MLTFIISISILILAYFSYGKFIEKFFSIDDSKITPAIKLEDGVDYIPMKKWKMFTIQFLNIAGLGPIFGAILGAMYGPISYIWIVLGCIFMGAVHDYFSGMISIRHNGISMPEIVGKYLGNTTKYLVSIFTLMLLIFVGVAFVNGPASLLAAMTKTSMTWWLYIIFAYYLIATLLPINKIIGKIYPLFGIALLIMAVSIAVVMIYMHFQVSDFSLNEISLSSLKNMHCIPHKNILFPMMFIVLSCGAISGFHSTQSPMMARCMTKESYGRPVFYGSMIVEGIVAMIWATAAMNFYGDVDGLNQSINSGVKPAQIVNLICNTWLGKSGAIIAIIGVIACPITTGDTAFRSARLSLADLLKINQSNIKSRLYISIPLFIVGFILSQIDFATIWKYVGISNQILSVIMLWTASAYLMKNNKNHLYLSIPALFMSLVCSSYILVAPYSSGGLFLSPLLAYSLSVVFSIFLYIFMTVFWKNRNC